MQLVIFGCRLCRPCQERILDRMATQAVDVSGVTAAATRADGGRFATYVTELREFFASSGMKFGAPEDLAGFAKAIHESGTFADELGSLTRSVLYREQGAVALPELLEMMTVAMGGPRIAEAAEQVREPFGELLIFVGKAMRNGRGPALVESAASKTGSNVSVSETEHFGVPTDAEAVVAEAESHGTEVPMVPTEIDSATNPGTVQHQHVSKDFYARARSLSPKVEVMGSAAPLAGPESELAGITAITGADAEMGRERIPTEEVKGIARDRSNDLEHDKQSTRSVHWRRALAICAVVGVVVAAVLLFQPWLPSPLGTRDEAAVVAMGPAKAGGSARDTVGTATPNYRNGSGAAIVSPTTNAGVGVGAVRGANSADGRAQRSANDSSTAASSNDAESATPPDRGEADQFDMQHPNPDGTESNRPGTVADSSMAEGTVPAGTIGAQRHDAPARVLPPTRMIPGRRAGVYTVSSGVMAGNLISAKPPDYPRVAGLLHIEGQVILQAVVSRNGRVIATHVLRGHRLLRGAAEDAVRHWRYRPYVANGQATDVATIVTVNFRRR